MKALKLIKKPKSQRLIIKIPQEFIDSNLEVILLKKDEPKMNGSKKEKFKKLLLNGPTYSVKELKEFKKVRKYLNESFYKVTSV